VKDPVVKLILDSSAVLAYARGSLDVGETIAEVVDEGDAFGASVLSLAEAARLSKQGEREGISLLAAHTRFRPLPAQAADWQRLASWAGILDSVQHAAAVIEAIDRDGYIITSEPHIYANGGENLPLIPF
jgi:hypothetical protein